MKHSTCPRPWVVFCFRVYAVFLTAIYGLLAVAFFLLAPLVASFEDGNEPPPWVLYVGAAIWTVLAGVCGVALAAPLRPWTWVFHLCLICLGMLNPVLLLVCIPLAIYWLKPETNAYYRTTR
jgi:hypothetical protein